MIIHLRHNRNYCRRFTFSLTILLLFVTQQKVSAQNKVYSRSLDTSLQIIQVETDAQKQEKQIFSFFTESNESAVEQKTFECAKEVFKDCMLYSEPQYLPTYKEQLRRVYFMTASDLASSNIISLSTLELKKKCNPQLTHDTKLTFDRNTFNPLKYRFNFYAPTDQYYRIDGTLEVIKIAAYSAE